MLHYFYTHPHSITCKYTGTGLGWTEIGLGWYDTGLGWTETGLGWTQTGLNWYDAGLGCCKMFKLLMKGVQRS